MDATRFAELVHSLHGGGSVARAGGTGQGELVAAALEVRCSGFLRGRRRTAPRDCGSGFEPFLVKAFGDHTVTLSLDGREYPFDSPFVRR